MTEPLSVVRYRSGKGCADGDALRKTADTRCLRLVCRISENSDQRAKNFRPPSSVLCPPMSRKEVIQPQVPLRLPCYDFTPVADLTVVGCPPFGCPNRLAHRLQVKPTPMV